VLHVSWVVLALKMLVPPVFAVHEAVLPGREPSRLPLTPRMLAFAQVARSLPELVRTLPELMITLAELAVAGA
jgi:hypothetical protein